MLVLSHTHVSKKMAHRRSRLEISLDVLRALKKGIAKPTRVMYDASLSWILLQDILASLTTQGFVEAYDFTHLRDKRSSVGYRLTQKGEKVISYFRVTMRARHALYAEQGIFRSHSQIAT